ncbi:hypothetical protein GF420_16175 [candidate division GN15 bacterium]|nr:hypothetical protein [candidate division GN15 bacterium]
MKTVSVTISRSLAEKRLVRVFEEIVTAAGLVVHSRGGVAARPGATHWHLRKPDQAGTLEATWSPATGQFWFSIHDHRHAAWIDDALVVLCREIERED